MLALDLRNLRWADELADRGRRIASVCLRRLQPSGTDLGPVLPEIARSTGLPESARVAVGGHDHVCGALAAGVVSPGMALNSMGTSEVMFLPLQEPLSDPQLGRQGYEVGVHVDGKHYYTMGIDSHFGRYAWTGIRDLFAAEMGYADLIEEARTGASGQYGRVFPAASAFGRHAAF